MDSVMPEEGLMAVESAPQTEEQSQHPPAMDVVAAIQRRERRFTVAEYHRLAEVGILHEDDPVELIEGRIVEMSPIGSRHIWCVNDLTALFSQRRDVRMSVQNPVRLGERSEPEPDFVLLRPNTSHRRTPEPLDVLLVVEVADSSLEYDTQVKSALYARAGIPEMWIADLGGQRIEVRREPSPDGYRLIRIAVRGQRIAPAFAPDFEIEVDAILGEPEDAPAGE